MDEYETLESAYNDLEDRVKALKRQNMDLEDKIDRLKGVLIKRNAKVKELLKDKVEVLKQAQQANSLVAFKEKNIKERYERLCSEVLWRIGDIRKGKNIPNEFIEHLFRFYE